MSSLDESVPADELKALKELVEAAGEIHKSLLDRFGRLLADWDSKLESLGGDPCREDWANFRPLRLTREEAWSDWLAHLLEKEGADLAQRLFRRDGGQAGVEHCRREVPTENCRADLVVEWKDRQHVTHLEVKLEDRDYEKTFRCAPELEEHYRKDRKGSENLSWTDFILLPEERVGDWRTVAAEHKDERRIDSLTWTDVAIELRRALWQGHGDARWRAWASGFCGAIEQRLLGHLWVRKDERVDRQFARVETIGSLGSMVRVMGAKGAPDEEGKQEMENQLDHLVRLGIKALPVLAEFYVGLGKKLKKALEARLEGGRWDPLPRGTPSPWPYSNRSVGIDVRGQFRGADARLRVQVWWGPPVGNVPVLQLDLSTGTESVDLMRPEDASEVFKSGCALRMGLSDDLDIREAFNRLIDAALAGLSKTAAT
jgi:hypothetical protein